MASPGLRRKPPPRSACERTQPHVDWPHGGGAEVLNGGLGIVLVARLPDRPDASNFVAESDDNGVVTVLDNRAQSVGSTPRLEGTTRSTQLRYRASCGGLPLIGSS